MKNTIFVLIVPLLICLTGCVPLWVMNQPEPIPPPRPLDMQNIFFSERVVGISRQYSGDKVLFIADISTSPYGQQYEAFLADKDGKNLVRLSFDGARRVRWIFDGAKFLVLTSSLVIFDSQTKNEVNKIPEVEEACVSRDGKEIAFIRRVEYSDKSSYKSNSMPYYAVYTMGEDLQPKKIIDLPPQIRPALGPFSKPEKLFQTEEHADLTLNWTNEGISFCTYQYTVAIVSDNYTTERTYMVNPDGSNLRVVEQKRVR